MLTGQKIEVDIDSDDDGLANPVRPPTVFIGDVLEREPSAPRAPTVPSLKSKSGFPEHRKRPVASRFKQQKNADASSKSLQPSQTIDGGVHDAPPRRDSNSGKAKSWEEEEKERIDQDNRQQLAAMSAEEIQEERQELMNSLSPALLQRLLQRSNIGSGSVEEDLTTPIASKPHSPRPQASKSSKTVTFDVPKISDVEEPTPTIPTTPEPSADEHPPHDTMHFPKAAQPPPLDPSSDNFFSELHENYFANLPADPDKLEWMQPSTTQSQDSYNPSSAAFGAKDIRFAFTGNLIPPRVASEIPVTAGLHHHGDAPDAAGYTIAELAHLSRSSFAAQRCIAFQTLGRILYRLSKGEFGNASEKDGMAELAKGLWAEVERLQVIQILVDESEGRGVDGGKHMSSKAYATEAVWLWRKGGGGRTKAE